MANTRGRRSASNAALAAVPTSAAQTRTRGPIVPLVNPHLTTFEGREVIGSSVAITRAGDGLSDALAVEAQEYRHGETVFVVLECEVSKVRFDPVKDTNALRRVHTLVTVTATTVEKDLVGELIDEQRNRIDEARSMARLKYDPANDAEVATDDNGEPL
jgi:hypothetical protein